jgi:hypothetical protein
MENEILRHLKNSIVTNPQNQKKMAIIKL